MKKTISMFGAIFFIFGSRMIAVMFPEQLQALVGLVCITLGAALSTVFVIEEEQKIGRIRDLLQDLVNETNEISKSINENNKIVIEQLQKNQEEALEKLTDTFDSTNEKVYKISDELQTNISNEVRGVKLLIDTVHSDILAGNTLKEKIQTGILSIEKMPERMYQTQDELIEKLENNMLENSKVIAEFGENIHNNNKNLLKEVKNNLRNITDSMDDYERNVAQKVEQLAQQYQDFKNYNNEIINKMTLMSNEDYELLKGLFNGKKKG